MRRLVALVLALGLGTASAAEPGLALDPVVSAEIARAKSATIAVSAKGRVALAIATDADLQHWDWTHAAGPQKRWTLAAKVAAQGEDRPQIGFFEELPAIVALNGHSIEVYRPEGPSSSTTSLLFAASGSGMEPECVVAGPARGRFTPVAWTSQGGLMAGFTAPGGAGAATIRKAVCPCCRPAIAYGPEGSTFIAYRDERGAGEKVVRDIYLIARYGKGERFADPVRVSKEGWTSPSCPMAGPAILPWSEERLVVAYVIPGKDPELKVAVSSDGGASFSDAVKVATGKKPQLCAIGERGVILAYEGKPDGVYAALSADRGATFGAPLRVDGNATGVASSGVALSDSPDKKSAYVSWIDKAGEKRAVCVRRIALKE